MSPSGRFFNYISAIFWLVFRLTYTKKASPIPGWIVIAILALIAAFVGYMFLVVLPRKKAKEAFADIEDDELEEEYADESEQSIPEDDGEPGDDEEEDPLDIPFEDDRD